MDEFEGGAALKGDVDEAAVDDEDGLVDSNGTEGDGEDDEDDDDYIDIDTEVVFEEVAKGKDYITFQDLTEWELIKGLREAGQMDDAELREILAAAGVKNENKMDIVAFEAVLDELSAGLDDDDEDE
jgi:hypothetical protein